ncbi:MAG: hypothetical protein AAF533_27100 [Acidobacteriota bacterium]
MKSGSTRWVSRALLVVMVIVFVFVLDRMAKQGAVLQEKLEEKEAVEGGAPGDRRKPLDPRIPTDRPDWRKVERRVEPVRASRSRSDDPGASETTTEPATAPTTQAATKPAEPGDGTTSP